MLYDLIILGGGASGIFAAINAKLTYPTANILLLEKNAVLLTKVRISGGGRCNVTHACFEPKQLIKNYPRGEKELLGPFHVFGPADTIKWFASKGVLFKTEADGRIFPQTDQSETIIQTLLQEAHKLSVIIKLTEHVEIIENKTSNFTIYTKKKEIYQTTNLLLATGSNSQGYRWAEQLGHTIQKPVPSLFTFNVPSSSLKDLSGVSIPSVRLQILGTKLIQEGAILITHFGFSGPAILKLSAWGSKYLHEQNYQTQLMINWVTLSKEEVFAKLQEAKTRFPHKTLLQENLFDLPKNLWKAFLEILDISYKQLFTEISLQHLKNLAQKLTKDCYQIEGKTLHKQEFVTCGGVTLKEVNFKTMQSKICSRLFFAGEILDIDGITGGFNFQNAWTTGYIAGKSSLQAASSKELISDSS
ncbi:NAD(P)/FAD-dependent oxidoreductase [Candidatus Rhabdochlamydia porcellionis]|jgi:predicted Rossmann fold flavoprotein|uniref:3-dehydro-bile acid Delta(4,6)-reductase n=1 Tax=Candidatus Rhabdochlamydia porcellionis TaxID=225148 RepID=A0ABX8Z0N7_9BACT|nr:NAD(P)/FAD-dependent oxidoreductase [Candidatus Rhabdochlamydia porcellionis]QZA59236.1 3-dehydro-bile acid Delta(4,6)-reductase [Candidatus Rhabdochlamydia porcellionis]